MRDFILLGLGILILLHSRVGGQDVTVCSAQGNTTCAQSNRICINQTGSEICGNCTSGYLDLSKFLSTAGCQSISELPWEAFSSVFKPQYSSASQATEGDRLNRLTQVMQFVSDFHAQIPPPIFSVGLNKYSADLPEDHDGLTGNRPNSSAATNVGFERFSTGRMLQNLPSSIDWEALGGTTYVKDQGRCGCCWSISAVGAVEGSAFVTNGFLESLSFQQLISCDTDNDGCNGGNVMYAMNYAVKNSFGGLASLNSYPYEESGGLSSIKTIEESFLSSGQSSSPCDLTGKSVAVEVYNPRVVVTFTDSTSFDERAQLLKSATAQQPVSVSLSSNCDTMISYSGGVMTDDGDCSCEDANCIDHAVLLVGYDDSSNPPFWKLKNSWGADWGESGYFRVSQEGGGNWGLFGLLGEGVVALKAVNTTGEQPDVIPWDNKFTWWQILFMVLGGVLGLCFIATFVNCLCCRPSKRSK